MITAMPVAWAESRGGCDCGRELSTINTTAGLAKARASITIIPLFHASHATSICNLNYISAQPFYLYSLSITDIDTSPRDLLPFCTSSCGWTWRFFHKNMTFINSFLLILKTQTITYVDSRRTKFAGSSEPLNDLNTAGSIGLPDQKFFLNSNFRLLRKWSNGWWWFVVYVWYTFVLIFFSLRRVTD